MEAAIREFWNGYLNSLNENVRRQEQPDDIFAFGDNPKMADELAALVKQGVKTATVSALRCYEAEQKALPKKGNLSIVLDGNGLPIFVIETNQVFVTPFNEVTESFAYEEGEGDRSLAYWRKSHRTFFSFPAHDNFDDRMPLVCERFKVVYPLPGYKPSRRKAVVEAPSRHLLPLKVKLAPHFSGRIYYARSIRQRSLVAKKLIYGLRAAKHNFYGVPVTDNAAVTAVLADVSPWEAISVAAAIANQLQMA